MVQEYPDPDMYSALLHMPAFLWLTLLRNGERCILIMLPWDAVLW